MTSFLEDPTSATEVRETMFPFRLPTDDARWLAVEVATRLATTQRLLIAALHGVRRGGSSVLSELMTSDKAGKRARKAAVKATKTTILRLSEDEARWVLVEAAKRGTSAPTLLTLIVRDIRAGGSPLLDELMASPPRQSQPCSSPRRRRPAARYA